MRVTDDLILVDFFSFTAPHLTYAQAVDFLGMTDVKFMSLPGVRGWAEKSHFENITIHHGAKDFIWVEMSGQGCRAFEDYAKKDWQQLMADVVADPDIHVTRLDLAFDDHSGLLPMRRLMDDVRSQNYVSRFGYWEVIESSKGSTINLGSPTSEIRFRIYDKAAEQGKEGHWVRFEIQARRDRAANLLGLMYGNHASGDVFASVVNNYIRFVNPKKAGGGQRMDQKDRWPNRKYWDKFVVGAGKVTLYAAPGMEYNIGKLYQFSILQAGAAAATYIKVMGLDDFLNEVDTRLKKSDNYKYHQLIEKYGPNSRTVNVS